ncbi:hypothetical protein [Granulicella mallensis]|uniref:Alkylhydroperoxidase family enzyme n=1 Tax=Granulicella mallensis TaxID=940614 RepID=A0A7W8EAW0_9BACT|nr:hypothetical protein [Granulicella mallensis]MBB5063905.1 alkylhydroperoxidase family enzyme [Granulicella mallensis]
MPDEPKISLELTMRALLLISLKGLDVDAQVETLLRAGFSNVDVADLTGMTANAVGLRKLKLKKKGTK